jgi:hypothetical protein
MIENKHDAASSLKRHISEAKLKTPIKGSGSCGLMRPHNDSLHNGWMLIEL